MKNVFRRSILFAVFISLVLISSGVSYAAGGQAQNQEKQAAVEKKAPPQKAHGHEKGSAECTAAHKNANCACREAGKCEDKCAYAKGESVHKSAQADVKMAGH